MGNKATIQINGKQYDAVTGAVLGAASAPAVRGSNIDGFFRGRGVAVQAVKTPPNSDSFTTLHAPHHAPKPARSTRPINHARAHAPEASKTVAIRVANTVHHSQKLTVHRSPAAPNHTKAHTTQHSQTLMRKSVARPVPSFHKQAQTQGSLQHAVPSLIVPKKSVLSLDEQRLARAQSTSRSPHIAHHTAPKVGVHPTLAPLAVQPVPVKPHEEVPSTTPSPTPTNKPTDIFEHALANATHYVDIQAHRAHFKKKTRRHVASMAAGTFALLVIAGFALYQNTPGIQFKVASLQAGVSTTMPDVKAAGFAYNGVRAADGKLTVGFSDASGDYQLTEAPTNWSDQDMIQSVGATDATGKPLYKTVQAGNVQIYRFGNTEATWVQDGQWYTVTGTGALSDQQVTSLVKNI